MNFNFNNQPEYQLHSQQTEELIRLYGTKVQFVFMDKIQDFTEFHSENSVFNDFKALKPNNEFNETYYINVLLYETEGYNNGLNFNFNNFGLINDDTIQVLVSIEELQFLSVDSTVHPKELVSNCLVFPNGKVMEVTDCQYHTPGINNKFVYSDLSTCYTLSLKSHNFDNSAVSIKRSDGAIKSKGMEDFIKNREHNAELIKLEAQKDTLIVDKNTLELSTKKSAVIDDVFGTY